ncbi:MAG: OmpA family protein [Steroidobacteraceae bacterium]
MLTIADSTLTGVRSTNGAPFRLYMGSRDARSVGICTAAAARLPGCGDTLYGVQFDFDSAAIRPESGVTLDRLGRGLQSGAGTSITIVGHTSAEGSVEYNRELSQRRAAAVVDALVARGFTRERLDARGAGETQPIADNLSEAGRALNRRVEVRCQ